MNVKIDWKRLAKWFVVTFFVMGLPVYLVADSIAYGVGVILATIYWVFVISFLEER